MCVSWSNLLYGFTLSKWSNNMYDEVLFKWRWWLLLTGLVPSHLWMSSTVQLMQLTCHNWCLFMWTELDDSSVHTLWGWELYCTNLMTVCVYMGCSFLCKIKSSLEPCCSEDTGVYGYCECENRFLIWVCGYLIKDPDLSVDCGPWHPVAIVVEEDSLLLGVTS